MTAADAVLQIREAAGRRARDEALMLGRLVETLRLASFRSFLSATSNSDVLVGARHPGDGGLRRRIGPPAHSAPPHVTGDPAGSDAAHRASGGPVLFVSSTTSTS